MKHASLFTGIGGFDLAAQWMGWENVFQVEIDSYCQKVLEKNFPNVKRHADIREFDGTQYRGLVDIVSGGFPCQPFSVAGKLKGNEDERALWFEMFRAIREIQPRYVVAENVPGLLSIERGMVFEQVCVDLESAGYEVQPIIIPAASKNAPHKRDRIWIVAHSDSFGKCAGLGSVQSTNGEISERNNDAEPCDTNFGNDATHTHSNGEMVQGRNGSCNDKKRNGQKKIQERKNEFTGAEFTDRKDATNSPFFIEERGKPSRDRAGQPETEIGNRDRDDSDTNHAGLQRFNKGTNGEWQSSLCSGLSSWDEPWLEVATRFCRMDDGIPEKLDENIIQYEKNNYKEAFTEDDFIKWEIMRNVWSNRVFAKASPRLQFGASQNSLPTLPCFYTHEGRNMGERIKESKELCSLWERIYSKPLEETQDLQLELLVRIRATERAEKVENRVHRLKGLGNAIVPEIAFEIFKAIQQVA